MSFTWLVNRILASIPHCNPLYSIYWILIWLFNSWRNTFGEKKSIRDFNNNSIRDRRFERKLRDSMSNPKKFDKDKDSQREFKKEYTEWMIIVDNDKVPLHPSNSCEEFDSSKIYYYTRVYDAIGSKSVWQPRYPRHCASPRLISLYISNVTRSRMPDKPADQSTLSKINCPSDSPTKSPNNLPTYIHTYAPNEVIVFLTYISYTRQIIRIRFTPSDLLFNSYISKNSHCLISIVT